MSLRLMEQKSFIKGTPRSDPAEFSAVIPGIILTSISYLGIEKTI